MTSLIRLDNISVTYNLGRRAKLTAVDEVTLDIEQGQTVGLIGESGSGKSTIARALTGLSPVSAGRIMWRGRDVATFDRGDRRQFSEDVQMVFQDPHSALDPRRTIIQSVREPLDVMNRGNRDERANIVRQALAAVGLGDHLADRYPHQLSGGQKQRANIARALVTRPKLLICDESVAALDVALQAEILNLLEDLKAEYDLTILFISHDLGVVSHVSDRIAVMYLGRIVEKANADELVEHPLHPYSQALLSAQPDIAGADDGKRIILRGDIPSPLNPPSGCRFHTRCPQMIEACRTTDPQAREVKPDRVVACLRVDNQPQAAQGATQ